MNLVIGYNPSYRDNLYCFFVSETTQSYVGIFFGNNGTVVDVWTMRDIFHLSDDFVSLFDSRDKP